MRELLPESAFCSTCSEAGFSPEDALFDPAVLLHVPELDSVQPGAWRIHHHRARYGVATAETVYAVEFTLLLTVSFNGLVVFTGVADPVLCTAVQRACAAARTLLMGG